MHYKRYQKGVVLVLTLLLLSTMTVLTIMMLERTMLAGKIASTALKQATVSGRNGL